MKSVTTAEYMGLIKKFIDGGLSPAEFESEYLDLFKSDESVRDEDEFLILDRLFSDVDVYSNDPKIRPNNGLDDAGLLSAARHAYEKLEKKYAP